MRTCTRRPRPFSVASRKDPLSTNRGSTMIRANRIQRDEGSDLRAAMRGGTLELEPIGSNAVGSFAAPPAGRSVGAAAGVARRDPVMTEAANFRLGRVGFSTTFAIILAAKQLRTSGAAGRHSATAAASTGGLVSECAPARWPALLAINPAAASPQLAMSGPGVPAAAMLALVFNEKPAGET